MLYFCTLFDSFYLSRGLVMYESLRRHCPQFHLYIFPFDDASYKILKELNLKDVTLVSLAEFENKALLDVKPGRSKGEYCWTCTSSTIHYCLSKFNIPHCTYIDADLCFYADPSVLVEEMGDKSILITEHRYTPAYDQSATSGIYCVQFVTFKNNKDGLVCLEWWRDRCIEWCYGRFEDGKFGDQKYLDDWTKRFNGVHVLEHIGGGVAPWNVQQYHLTRKNGSWLVTEKATGKVWPLIFYHYHYVKLFSDGTVNLSDKYDLGSRAVFELYKDYLTRLDSTNERLTTEFGLKTPAIPAPVKPLWFRISKRLYNQYKKIYGIYNGLVLKDLIKS